MSREPKKPHLQGRWQKNIRAVLVAETLAVLGFNLMVPVLPFYIRTLSGSGEREARLWVGIVYSTPALAMFVSAPLWGALSDRYGRKVMVGRAMFGGAVANGLMGWARSIPQLVVLRAIQGALAGTVAAAATLVSASAPKERAGRVLGLLQMAIYAGAALGPLLGGALAARLEERFTFWITGLLLLVAGLAVAIFVEEPGSSGAARGQKDVAAKMNTNWTHRVQAYLGPVFCSAPLGGILLVDLLTRLGSRVIIPMMPLFVETISSPGPAAVSSAGLVAATGAGAAALGSLYFGRLGDNEGHQQVLTFCILFAGLGCIPQFFVRSMGSLVALQVGVGLALGGAVALLTASLAKLAPDGKMGIVYGVDMSVVCVANVIGPMLGSLLSALMGLRVVFLAAASIFAVAGFLAFRLRAKYATDEAASRPSDGLEPTDVVARWMDR